MIIRRAKPTELDDIFRLNLFLFKYEHQFNKIYNLDWTYSKIGKNYFKKRLNHEGSIALVAVDNKKIIGYLIAFFDNYPYRSINPLTEIENMYVEEKYRSQGVGKKLVEKCKELLKKEKVKRLKVEAFSKNSPAHRFYKSCGFENFNTILEQSL